MINLMGLSVILLGIHVLAGVAWAGSTFTLACLPQNAGDFFGKQMMAATVSILAGVGLWGLLHRGPPGPMEWTLIVGVVCAVAAAGVQGALRRSAPLLSQRIAALLLTITVLTMTLARYTP